MPAASGCTQAFSISSYQETTPSGSPCQVGCERLPARLHEPHSGEGHQGLQEPQHTRGEGEAGVTAAAGAAAFLRG